jgi:signal transduction histidine kinase
MERRAGNVRFTVRDQGPGLEPQQAAGLLKMESQGPTKLTSADGSSGLGLRIVRHFVQQMRGKVWCESEPGQGATFIVEIPAAP